MSIKVVNLRKALFKTIFASVVNVLGDKYSIGFLRDPTNASVIERFVTRFIANGISDGFFEPSLEWLLSTSTSTTLNVVETVSANWIINYVASVPNSFQEMVLISVAEIIGEYVNNLSMFQMFSSRISSLISSGSSATSTVSSSSVIASSGLFGSTQSNAL